MNQFLFISVGEHDICDWGASWRDLNNRVSCRRELDPCQLYLQGRALHLDQGAFQAAEVILINVIAMISWNVCRKHKSMSWALKFWFKDKSLDYIRCTLLPCNHVPLLLWVSRSWKRVGWVTISKWTRFVPRVDSWKWRRAGEVICWKCIFYFDE